MARNAALRRAGPPVVAGLALLLGGITVWYAWVVARHLRDDARQTSSLLGRVFAGLNDPRPDAATDALLDLARQVRSLGIAIVVMDTAGHITALDNAPPEIGADTAHLRAWISELDVENPPLVQPGVGTIHYGTGTAARRFASIGRPARREPVGLGALAERVVSYFRPRLPTLASPVTLTLRATGPGPTALGDPVLLEWALEAVIKNAIDALSGRGGRIDVAVEAAARTARLSVIDDGPGVPLEVRAQLFEPGVSTKPGGWGIGLALARRIVEQQHGGRLVYRPAPTGEGAEFVLEFPLVSAT